MNQQWNFSNDIQRDKFGLVHGTDMLNMSYADFHVELTKMTFSDTDYENHPRSFWKPAE